MLGVPKEYRKLIALLRCGWMLCFVGVPGSHLKYILDLGEDCLPATFEKCSLAKPFEVLECLWRGLFFF